MTLAENQRGGIDPFSDWLTAISPCGLEACTLIWCGGEKGLH